jgi:two-component system chemotaxis sensor kinase CheA
MDVFTFVATTRADPVLREVPAILVTSRSAPEDRRRGAEAGASGYVVKGDFDQGQLLTLIRSLVR